MRTAPLRSNQNVTQPFPSGVETHSAAGRDHRCHNSPSPFDREGAVTRTASPHRDTVLPDAAANSASARPIASPTIGHSPRKESGVDAHATDGSHTATTATGTIERSRRRSTYRAGVMRPVIPVAWQSKPVRMGDGTSGRAERDLSQSGQRAALEAWVRGSGL